jgi:hypothetical protein
VIAAALFLAQAAAWTAAPDSATVGDTVWVSRRVGADPAARPRVVPIAGTDVLEPLGAPRFDFAEGRLVVRYPVALFEPGDHAVSMPDIELRYPDGRTVIIPGDTARLVIRSVLPPSDTLPAARPSLAPLGRVARRVLPLTTFVGAVLAALGVWGVVRRRRRPRPVWATRRGSGAEPPLAQWVAAGEPRAVAAVLARQVRERLAELVPAAGAQLPTAECLAVLERERPSWPHREIAELLRTMERARFAPVVPEDVVTLGAECEALLDGLAAAPAEAGSAGET